MSYSLSTKKIGQPRPILKWAGGKQQLLEILLSNIPATYNRYIEPFFGGGALFFGLRPQNSIISDFNPELINLYRVVAQNVQELIAALKNLPNDKELFLNLRAKDPATLSSVEQAARTIYLNRTCFNGLYRVNKSGQFNTPFGNYHNPKICDENNLMAASRILQTSQIILSDYKAILENYAQPGDFIYLDPPYMPISSTSDFKRYTKVQFYEKDHIDLAERVHNLHELGCHVLLSNSNHPLVHELYSNYRDSIIILQTKRNISSDASKRMGEDILINIKPRPRRKLFINQSPITLSSQVEHFPSTRYMGSKQALLKPIWEASSQFNVNTVLDLFSGSGVVSYMFKAQGKQVISNDYLAFCSLFTKSMVENNCVTLSEQDLNFLCNHETPNPDRFVSDTFRGLYFSDDDNLFIDKIRANINYLEDDYKKAITMASLVRSCLKKRARGIFTYTGNNSDDGRRDLRLSLKDQFCEAVDKVNKAVFNNRRANISQNVDSMEINTTADLVYIDPPYFSPLSDNDYTRRYHFVEGLARNWKNVDLQAHTKTKKFKSFPTPFSKEIGAYKAFETLLRRHQASIIIVSYSSNSLPTKNDLSALLSKYKQNVKVIEVDYRYSFGNQGHKVDDNKNSVQEYLFIGY